MNQQRSALVTAYYDPGGFCHTIEVRLDFATMTPEDVAQAVRSVYEPARGAAPRGNYNEGGVTQQMPAIRIHGSAETQQFSTRSIIPFDRK